MPWELSCASQKVEEHPWPPLRRHQSVSSTFPPKIVTIGRNDAKAEAPILWPPDVKSQLIGKDPDAGKD